MAPATPGSDAGAGRFASRWQQRAASGSGAVAARPLDEVDQKRLRALHAKRKYALSGALDRGHIEDAVDTADEMKKDSQEIPHDLLYRLIYTAADCPGVERFARVVNICIALDIRFDVMEWAALVGRLMARDAPHAQVRVCLNFGLPPDGKVMELAPVEANRQSDIEKCFAGAEHHDIGELSDEEDLAVILHGKAATGLRPPPKHLIFQGCSFRKLNGTYRKMQLKDWESALSSKVVYQKKEHMGDKHPLYCYFYEPEIVTKKKVKVSEDAEQWKAGWYIGTEVGGGGMTYAYCEEDKTEIPPTFAQWHVLETKNEKMEFLGFETKQKKQSFSKVIEWDEAKLHLTSIDLESLPNRVNGNEHGTATRYFTHFFILLHLEHLAEVAGFRGRFGYRSAGELASFGIALVNIEVDNKWNYSDESRRMPLPGWPDVGHEKVSFKLPRKMPHIERFGIKKGESLLISRGDPLKSRVTEGSVIDVDLMTRQLTMNVNGKFPDFDLKKAKFRLDCYANRTTFERQLTALLQFITMKRTKMQDMLIAAGVGNVDLAVLGGDGFCDPSEGTKLAKDEAKARRKLEAAMAIETPEEAEAKAAAQAAGKKAKKEEKEEPQIEVTDEQLECLDEGMDFGRDGTWIDVVVSQEADMEEVEVDPEEAEEAEEPAGQAAQPVGAVEPPPELGEDGEPLHQSLASRLLKEEELEEEEMAKQLARELAQDDDAGEIQQPRTLEPPKLEATDPLAVTPSLPPVVPVAADDGLSTEERNRKATLALATEDAEGINPDLLSEAKNMVDALPDLSVAQRNALNNSLSKRLTIVQGPPGTGKTHTSVRILTMWAKQMKYTPLLATSECNIAVDNIAEGLAKAGVKVVRIGRPEKVRDILEPVCLDHMVKADREERAKNQEEGSDLEELGEEPWDETGEEHKEWESLRKRWRRRRAWDRKEDAFARARFVEQAEVLCATTTTAGSQALTGFKFRAILIDEVAQATETSAIVPIVCRGAQQIALCGDHCQLPPSTVSREAELRGMSLSLYSRLVEAGVPFQFLDTQYRAHPALMEFSATCIYQGKLKNGIDGSQRPIPKGVDWPNPKNPAAFFECDVPEGLNGESKDNPGEAEMVLKLIENCLKEGDITLNDIGVVTPYKGQVRTLRQKIFAKFPEAKESRELEIASVDNFQGREKELIVFSAVRCNKEARVGFLNDWRRLNVMITRARRGLVVIGNAATLCCDKHWRMWMQFTERQGGCPKGTVSAALKEAMENLEEFGSIRMKKRLFPEANIDEILAKAPAAGEDVLARANMKKEKLARQEAKKKMRFEREGPGKDEDFDYLADEAEDEDENEWEEQPAEAAAPSAPAAKKADEAAAPAKQQAAKKQKSAEAETGGYWEEGWEEEWQESTAWGILEKKPGAKAAAKADAAGSSALAAGKAAAAAAAAKKRKAAEDWAEEDWAEGDWEGWEEPAPKAAAKKPKAAPKSTASAAAKATARKAAVKEEWGEEEWAEEWEEPASAAPKKPKAAPKQLSALALAAAKADMKKEKEWWEDEEPPPDASEELPAINSWGLLGGRPSVR